MFRYRIKDLMILIAVLAIGWWIVISLGYLIVPLLLVAATLLAPVIWVETYLYRKKNGTWYRWRNPRNLPPRYPETSRISPYYRWTPVQKSDEPHPSDRTRLFQSATPSDPVSRASLLLKVASRLETSGHTDAAARIYREILEHFGDTIEARDAGHRLQSRSPIRASVEAREN